MKNIKVEVCAASVQSALNAQEAGAHRIELCNGLELGGITPSPAVIQASRELLNIDIFVLIRPRAGDFCYTDLEFEVIKKDILFCKNLPASSSGKKIDGVVVGVLLKDGNIDVERTKTLVDLAAPMKVTFHRAFDRAIDPFLSLEKVIETSAHKILTSGQFANAYDGRFLLQQLVEKANGRISIMPGAGVNAQNITAIAQTTLATEFHLSGKNRIQSSMTFENPNFGKKENDYSETDVEKIKATVKAVNHLQ